MESELPNRFASMAQEIHSGDPLRSAEIEARILADQPQVGIAIQMALPMEVVAEYETRFFNVRHRLADQEWVWAHVIGGQPSDVIDPRDVGRYWRCVAYNANKLGLLELMPLFAYGDREKLKKQGLSAYLEENVPLLGLVKMEIARACCPVLSTEWGVRCAKTLAQLPNWRELLPEGGLEVNVFAEIVAMYHRDFERDARKSARWFREVGQLSGVE